MESFINISACSADRGGYMMEEVAGGFHCDSLRTGALWGRPHMAPPPPRCSTNLNLRRETLCHACYALLSCRH